LILIEIYFFKIATHLSHLSPGRQCRARRFIQFFLTATLAQTFNNLSSALTGAAITALAFAEPFIAAGAAVGFWYFFPTEKGLGPRGYERNEIINAWWVTPSTREFVI
jgi:hypothetical protein